MRADARLLAALAVRLLAALVLRTAFAPDEFWQSLEVAHRLAFGYGHLTWEWAAGLRSYVHPLLFAAPYAALRALRLDTPWAVARVPLLLQALAAAATDSYVARLAGLVLGPQAASWCLLCQLASWFNAYCLARTYSNCLEALAAAAGTYHWLLSGGRICAASSGSGGGGGAKGTRGGGSSKREQQREGARRRRHQRTWIACAALSVVVRPSSALFWALPAGVQLWRQRGRALWLLLLDAVTMGGGLLGASLLVDRALYGRWVAPPWEFLRFNLLQGASAQYGGHPWHWNLSQGLPAVAASLLPLLAGGLLLAAGGHGRQLALLAAWSLATYSLPTHKEFRFLLPALQLLMPYCGLAASRALGSGSGQPAAGQQRGRGRSGGAERRPAGRVWRWGAAACLALQLPMALYFMLVHQGAQVGVMAAIRREAAARPADTSVLFLTPCHATPYYTHVHRPIPMRFLDCSPPPYAAATAALNAAAQDWLRLPQPCGAELSQRACLERDPAAYLDALFGANPEHQWPRLLVLYTPLLERVGEAALAGRGYGPRARLPNCWVRTDDDSPCELQLWSRP